MQHSTRSASISHSTPWSFLYAGGSKCESPAAGCFDTTMTLFKQWLAGYPERSLVVLACWMANDICSLYSPHGCDGQESGQLHRLQRIKFGSLPLPAVEQRPMAHGHGHALATDLLPIGGGSIDDMAGDLTDLVDLHPCSPPAEQETWKPAAIGQCWEAEAESGTQVWCTICAVRTAYSTYVHVYGTATILGE